MYNKPFVVSKKKWETFIKYYSWGVKKYDLLEDITWDEQIFAVPFSQIRERGFEVNDWGEKIISIVIDEKKQFNFEEFSQTFIEKESNLETDLQEHFSESEYKQIVKDIVEKEIWNGEWSNFLIAQKVSSKIKDFDIEVALSIFKRLLEGDYGSYLHYIFFDGERVFIGASPERNVSITPHPLVPSPLGVEGEPEKYKVRMNPISGTFKKAWYKNYLDFKGDFLDFLKDQKEIDELFMATDEELKMMSNICSSWWIIVWPILKEMANLVHSEYLLSWNSSLDRIEIFKQSMWASTVVWSPLESAFRAIKRYESFSRKYYSGAICYLEEWSLDSAIMIRTLQLDMEWNLEAYVWASLVKDSNPKKEYEEINIKLAWIVNAVLWIRKQMPSFTREYYLDDEVQELVQIRNQNLSKTWFFKQTKHVNEKLRDKKCVIINNEDDFTNMVAHLLKLIGLNVDIVRYSDVIKGDLINYDYVLVWPWPGNPLDDNDKMKKNLEIINYAESHDIKYFWICLWHQLICRYKWLYVRKKDKTTQWEQIRIDLFWRDELVAFYNTFAGFHNDKSSPWVHTWKDGEEIYVSSNDETWEVYSLRGENFFSFQFHPESILTKNGLEILEEFLLGV